MSLTPFLRLNKPPFDSIPWDQAINGNMDTIDGAMAQFMTIPNFGGAWINSTSYTVGQTILDPSNSTMWTCQVSHTSAAAPTTFATDRTNNPTYWLDATHVLVAGVTSFNTRAAAVTLTSGDVTSALTFTPYSASNPSGYQTAAQVTAAVPVASSTNPTMNGTVAVGTGTTWARADHVHASDTTRLSIAGGGVTGSITVTQNVRANNNLIADQGVFPCYAQSTSYVLGADATYNYITYATGWYWRYNRSNGDTTYIANGPSAWHITAANSFVSTSFPNAFKPGGGPWADTSDERIKKDVTDYTAGLDQVLQLRPVTYHYIEGTGRDTTKLYHGMIAQEVELVMPEMVEIANLATAKTLLANTTLTDVRLMDIGPLIYALVNSVKELATRLSALEARI